MRKCLFYKLLISIGIICIYANIVYAQDKLEKRVYYLDCSASMTGKYNIWDSVKLNLKNAIDAVTDETTELLVVPFANNTDFNQPLPLECKQEYATKEGKRELKRYIDNIATPNHSVNKTMTYHKIPLTDFVKYRIDRTKETYMFLMTDGRDEEMDIFKTKTFNDMVNNWHQYTGVKDVNDISDVYGIYVMLNSIYNDPSREELIKRTDYFWQFNTADVNIKRIKLNTEVVYNIRNENSVAINVDGNLQGIKFKLSTPYPNDIPFEIKETTIQGDKLIVGILPKENIDVHSLEESKDYIINIKMEGADELLDESKDNINIIMEGADEFTLLATPRIKLKCISKRENSVTVTHTQSAKTQSQSIWDNIKSMIGIDVDRSASFGTVHYYPSLFAWSPDSVTPVVDSIYFNFSQDAKLNNKVYAEFQFVDNEGKPYNSNVLTILDGDTPLPNNTLLISSTDATKQLKFVFSPEAETGKYQGYFRLVNHNLLHRIDHYFLEHLESNVLTDNKNDLNNKVNIFQWTLHYKKHLNPLLKNILWAFLLIVLLGLAILLAFLFRAILAPHFPSRCTIAFAPSIDFNSEKDHNFEFSFKQIAEGILVGNINTPDAKSNIINTHILKKSFIQKIILSPSKKTQIQTFIQRKWNGQIIHVSAKFYTESIKSIELIPIRVEGCKKDAKVIVRYSDKSDPFTIESIGLAKLDNQHTTTESICIHNTKVEIEGRVTYNRNANN